MLCPKCGADVGDTIRLCDNCESMRQARLKAEREAKEGASRTSSADQRTGSATQETVEARVASTQADRPPPNRPEQQEDKRSANARKAFLALLVILALIAIKVVKRAKTVESLPPTVGASTGGGLAPVATPAIGIISHAKGGLKLSRSEVRLGAGVALYNKKARQLQIAFFREEPAGLDQVKLRAARASEPFAEYSPEALLSLTFSPSSTTCNMASVSEYHLTVFRRDQGLALPSEKLSFPIRRAGVAPQASSLALESLDCGFVQGARITGTFRGARQIPVRDETPSLSWELSIDSAVVGPSATGGVSYDSSDAAATIALWNPAKSELNVGFFGGELSMAEREKIRRAGSFASELNARPDAVFSATLSNQRELIASSLKTYGMLFYRGRSAGLSFGGESDEVGIFFVAASENAGSLDKLSGLLSESNTVSGIYRHSVTKKIGEKEIPVEWNVSFNTPVLDLSVVSEENMGNHIVPTDAPGVSDANAAGRKNSVYAGDVGVDIVSVVAFYYEASGDLAVGFFNEQITPADVAELKRKKSLSSVANDKRAAMVLLLDLERGETISDDTLVGYTAYFYRNAAGSFQFPGFHDAVSFRRLKEQIPSTETVKVSGNVSKVQITAKGDGSSAQNPTRFVWNLQYEIQPEVIQ